jgi:hypothetical protein
MIRKWIEIERSIKQGFLNFLMNFISKIKVAPLNIHEMDQINKLRLL